MSDDAKSLVLQGDDGYVYKISQDDLQQYKVPEDHPDLPGHQQKLSRKKDDEDVCIFGVMTD